MSSPYGELRIAVLNQGWIRTELSAKLNCFPHQVIVYYDGFPVDSNRNQIWKEAKADGIDWLLMTDCDQHWEKNPLDYIAEDKDIIGFPTPIYQPHVDQKRPIRWNISKGKNAPLVRRELVGSGSLLIAKRVIQHPDMTPAFAIHYNEEGIRTSGEDMIFCDRANAAGFEIWAALNNPCHHLKEVDLLYLEKLLEREI